MNNLILHQYGASPFSEKVRLLLAYKQISYDWVDIPVIMPKPDLIPLTGGYRKTPVLQIGADVYCDSAIICQVVDSLKTDTTVYPAEHAASLMAVSYWTDTFFFKVAVAQVFQPKVLANHPLFSDKTAAAAFVEDRAKLREGTTEAPLMPAEAEAYWFLHLQKLDQQLALQPYLFGNTPTIADFSTYHCIWFVYNNDVLREDFEPYKNLLAWRTRMSAIGSGKANQITGEQALAVAKEAQPDTSRMEIGVDAGDFKAGDRVTILPIDYGFQPTEGKLLAANSAQIVIERGHELTGTVAVHFPRLGFQIQKT